MARPMAGLTSGLEDVVEAPSPAAATRSLSGHQR